MKAYKRRLTVAERAGLRSRVRDYPYLPNAFEFLRSRELQAVSNAMGGVEPRSLVDLRYRLADAFVQHVRDIMGDRPKPNRSERRKALMSLHAKAAALRLAVEENMPWLREEHYEAKFFGATGPEWSPFEHDYASMLKPIAQLETIVASILSVPPMGKGKATSPFLAGFPSHRLENPGTGAQFAFARRMAHIYSDVTGRTPGVTKEQAGPYHRLVAAASTAFRDAYKAAESPFGEWREPRRDVMQKACRSIGRKSS